MDYSNLVISKRVPQLKEIGNISDKLETSSAKEYLCGWLLEEREIERAKELLHEIYFEEMGWVPKTGNPSRLRYEHTENSKRLQDKYDRESRWIGLYYGEDLVGCIRVLFPQGGKFELEEYREIPLEFHENTSIEINRLAVKPEHRGTSACLRLMKEIALFCIHQKVRHVFAATTVDNPGRVLEKIGLQQYDGEDFKYYKTDPNCVRLYHIDCGETGEGAKKTKMICDRFIRGMSRFESAHLAATV